MTQPRRASRSRGDAVFRGKISVYTFKIFTLDSLLPAAPAVFLITRRSFDRYGRGHQQLLCVGESAALARELKKHRRCFRLTPATAICLLGENDEAKRAAIVDDLRAARSLGCLCDESASAKKERTPASPGPVRALTAHQPHARRKAA